MRHYYYLINFLQSKVKVIMRSLLESWSRGLGHIEHSLFDIPYAIYFFFLHSMSENIFCVVYTRSFKKKQKHPTTTPLCFTN